MAELNVISIKENLIDKRAKIEKIQISERDLSGLTDLLQQIDDAIERIESGTYGICEVCNGAIETELLLVDPLVTVCLDDMTAKQKKELENDIELASHIQRKLLPKNKIEINGWEIFYCYEPAGVVSGDYCDLIVNRDDHGILHFILGDISGKGIAASMLMTHLHAMIHSLVNFDLHVDKLIDHANRLFCESTSSSQYATLVYGRAAHHGEIEISNAGHCPPILLHNKETELIEATGLPVGLFCESNYSALRVKLEVNDYLVLYTDGLTETSNGEMEYGVERLRKILSEINNPTPEELVNYIVNDRNKFGNGIPKEDDMTIMVMKRVS